MRKLAALLLFVVTLQVCLGRTPTTYHVTTTGDDSHDGLTSGTAFATIHKCTQTVAAGDTCAIHAGTYDESVHIGFADPGWMGGETTAVGTSWNNPITLTNFGSDVVIWRQHTTDGILHIGGISAIDSSDNLYWIVNGITFDGQSKATNGLIGGGSNYLRVTNVTGYEAKESCFLVGGDHWDVWNSTFHDCGTGQNMVPDHCIYGDGRYQLIDGVTLYHCSGYGIQFHRQGQRNMDFNTIRNSRVYDNYWECCGAHTVGGGGGGIEAGTGNGDLIYNNIVYDTAGGTTPIGIDITFRCGIDSISNPDLLSCQVYHNTVFNIHGSAIRLGGDDPAMCDTFDTGGHGAGAPCTVAKVINNICFGNQDGCINDVQSIPVVPYSNNLSASDPLYTSSSTGDFTIPCNSPAVGYGLDLTSYGISGLLTDFTGAVRAMTTVGAYTCLGSGGSTMPGAHFHLRR